MKTIREMALEVRQVNVEKGWRDTINPWNDFVALLHSEVAEMLEAYRDWGLKDATGFGDPTYDDETGDRIGSAPGKPEGVGSEAADYLIRWLDMVDVFGLDVDGLYGHREDLTLADLTRTHPRATPSTFGGWNSWLHRIVADMFQEEDSGPDEWMVFSMNATIGALLTFCEHHRIDLEAEYARKIAYNRTRPYQHGGRTLAGKEST